jgi:hypothetical protein
LGVFGEWVFDDDEVWGMIVSAMSALSVLMLSMAAPPMLASRGGPEISWNCDLRTRDSQTLKLAGVFDKIPPDPKGKKIDGYKQLKNRFTVDEFGFFDLVSNAWVNDLTDEFGIAGKSVEKDGSKIVYSFHIQLGDDGVGIGRIQSYTDMPEDYKWELGKRFVHDRNLATGFCNHDAAKLRPL